MPAWWRWSRSSGMNDGMSLAPAPGAAKISAMEDGFGRRISYLRVSVTDRCDFRCTYCMAEEMTFLPRAEVLSLEEIERLCGVFVGLGVRKLRFTGGEPLVRAGVPGVMARVGARHLGQGLEELTLTTNGARLARFAPELAAAGVRRVNVSLDSLKEARFAAITRTGHLPAVLAGIEAAAAAGLAVKINMVALKGVNEDEISPMLAWCGARGFDLSLIETMPLGDMSGRVETHLSLATVRERLCQHWTLRPSAHATGGPSRYWDVAETGARIGFITPLSEHFCASCNRVRLDVKGRLYLCLGHEAAVDLRAPLRAGASDETLDSLVRAAMRIKPELHEFEIGRPAVARYMSATGG